jgi:hypothetical protein
LNIEKTGRAFLGPLLSPSGDQQKEAGMKPAITSSNVL